MADSATSTRQRPTRADSGAPPKETRRKKLRLILLAGLVATLAALGWYFTSLNSPLPVRAVVVTGASPDIADQVRAVAGITEGGPLADVDPGATAAAVVAIDGVNAAQVSWKWLNQVEITVSQQYPAAVRDDGQGLVVIDADGQTIRRVSERPAGLLLVAAPDQESLAATLAVAKQTPHEWLDQVAGISAPGPNDVSVQLTSGVTAFFGPPTEVPAKYQLVGQLIPTGAQQINVSVPNRPTLRDLPPPPDADESE